MSSTWSHGLFGCFSDCTTCKKHSVPLCAWYVRWHIILSLPRSDHMDRAVLHSGQERWGCRRELPDPRHLCRHSFREHLLRCRDTRQDPRDERNWCKPQCNTDRKQSTWLKWSRRTIGNSTIESHPCHIYNCVSLLFTGNIFQWPAVSLVLHSMCSGTGGSGTESCWPTDHGARITDLTTIHANCTLVYIVSTPTFWFFKISHFCFCGSWRHKMLRAQQKQWSAHAQ